MFEIKEITVTASCSKNYQKAEFTMTAMVECDEDIAAVKSLCTQHALQLLETLPIKEEPKQPVQAPVQRQQYQQPVNNQNPYFNQAPRNNKPAHTQFREFNGVDYKFCVNKNTGEKFWAICDQSLIGPNTPRYLKYEE